MKKWICLLLAGMLAFSACGAFGEETFPEEGGALDESEEMGETFFTEKIEYLTEYDENDLTVGNPTQLSGRFFTDLWGSNTSDLDVRQLVTGYPLAAWDGEDSAYVFNQSVVSGAVIGVDLEGNRLYLLSLYEDLYFSDGTPITAWDYAFSVLFQCSPAVRELGAQMADWSFLEGGAEYASGEARELRGLRVTGDHQLMFTVRAESLPYFYELSRFCVSPYPIQAIAPGCQVFDSGEGAYIGRGDLTEGPAMTGELLRGTVLAPDTGYLVHPVPGSGPYTIQSFDGETAVFEINPWYKGNQNGKKPRIRRLTYTRAENGTMIQELAEGRFALLNKVTQGQAIQEGQALTAERNQYTLSTYPRVGLTYLYFLPESPLLQSENVRKALALCFDKTEFIQRYNGYFGLETDGLYGLGQWMYQLAVGTIDAPVEMREQFGDGTMTEEAWVAAWEEITLDRLTRYPFDPQQAARLLEEEGWNLNEQGEAFQPGTDALRCRRTGDGLESLRLTLGFTGGQEIDDSLQDRFLGPLSEIGVQVSLQKPDVPELEQILRGEVQSSCDMLYLGNNFSSAFHPAALFERGDALYREGLAEDSLPAVHRAMKALAEDMDRTEPGDLLSYMRKWITFQENVSQRLPVIPVYMNVYFDFYTRELHEYWIAENPTWADAIVPARMYRGESLTEEELNQRAETKAQLGNEGGAIDLHAIQIARSGSGTPDAALGALASFPKEVRDQIPPEYRVINEFTTAAMSAEYGEIPSATILLSFDTVYPAGETVYLLFGRMEKGGVQWTIRPGEALEDGSVSVTLDEKMLERFAGQTFSLVAVSRE